MRSTEKKDQIDSAIIIQLNFASEYVWWNPQGDEITTGEVCNTTESLHAALQWSATSPASSDRSSWCKAWDSADAATPATECKQVMKHI